MAALDPQNLLFSVLGENFTGTISSTPRPVREDLTEKLKELTNLLINDQSNRLLDGDRIVFLQELQTRFVVLLGDFVRSVANTVGASQTFSPEEGKWLRDAQNSLSILKNEQLLITDAPNLGELFAAMIKLTANRNFEISELKQLVNNGKGGNALGDGREVIRKAKRIPDVTLDMIEGNSAEKQELMNAVKVISLAKGPFTLALVGPPGTGKSFLARALATEHVKNETNKRIYSLGAAELSNPWQGETENGIIKIFDEVVKEVNGRRENIAIILDEVDQLFGSSGINDGGLSKAGNTIQLELSGNRTLYNNLLVIIITNYWNKVPPAIQRRVSSKVYIDVSSREDNAKYIFDRLGGYQSLHNEFIEDIYYIMGARPLTFNNMKDWFYLASVRAIARAATTTAQFIVSILTVPVNGTPVSKPFNILPGDVHRTDLNGNVFPSHNAFNDNNPGSFVDDCPSTDDFYESFRNVTAMSLAQLEYFAQVNEKTVVANNAIPRRTRGS